MHRTIRTIKCRTIKGLLYLNIQLLHKIHPESKFCFSKRDEESWCGALSVAEHTEIKSQDCMLGLSVIVKNLTLK